MVRISSGSVVVLLFLQCSSLFATVPQLEFSYEADVFGHSFLNSTVASHFGIYGKVDFYMYDDRIVTQFSDLRTTVYNGPLVEFKPDSKTLPIGEWASVLHEPFVIYYEGNTASGLGVQPNEPMWSVNMKRATASIIQLEWGVLSGATGNYTESSIYGNCNVEYEVEDGSDTSVLKKTLNGCDETPEYVLGNVRSDLNWTLFGDILHTNVVRQYTISKNEEKMKSFKRAESFANVTLKTMPTDRRTQHIIQRQIFKFLDYTEVDFEFDFSKVVKKNLTYEMADDETITKAKDVDKLVEELRPLFDHYLEKLAGPAENYDYKHDTLTPMYNLITDIVNSVTNHSTELKSLLDNRQYNQLFNSFLPYVGSSKSVKYIKQAIESGEWHPLIAAGILSSSLTFIPAGNEELLEELEYLIHLDDNSPNIIRYSGIITFASAVTDFLVADQISAETFLKYANKYKQLWKETEDYDFRMMYMLGISNMVRALDNDFLLPLITDVHEYPQIRALATYAFRYALTDEEVYNSFWPVVNNETESLPVRVAALDTILSYDITKEQTDAIAKRFEKCSSDQQEQHLCHYFYTSTQFVDIFEEYKINGPESYRTLSTGKYGFDYHSPKNDIGGKFVTRLIANPNSNLVDTVIFSTDRHAMSLSLGKYTIYLKIEGVIEHILEDLIDYKSNAEEAIPELLKLLHKNNFKLKDSKNIHIDIVIFDQNKAILAYHTDSRNFGSILQILEQFLSPDGIQFPLLFVASIPSDLGTSITYTNGIEESFQLQDDYTVFRKGQSVNTITKLRYDWASSIELACENPITQLSISVNDVKSYKYQFELPLIINFDDTSIKWQNENVSFLAVVDITVATVVSEEDELGRYCSDCLAFYEYPEGRHFEDYNRFESLGITLEFNGTVSRYDTFEINQVASSFDELDFPADLFTISDIVLFKPPFDTFHMSVRTVPLYDEPTEGVIQLDLPLKAAQVKESLASGQIGGTVSYTNRKVDDGSILCNWNLTSTIQYKPHHIGDGKMHNNFSLDFDGQFQDGEKRQVCLYTDVIYPAPQVQMFSLVPSKPTEINININNGRNDCGDRAHNFTLRLSVSDEQKKFVKTLPEYDICKKQSEGLQFLPPIKECIKIANILTNYRKYDVEHRTRYQRVIYSSAEPNETSAEPETYEYEWVERQVINNSFILGVEKKDLTVVTNGTVQTEDNYNKYVEDYFVLNSIDRWYYDEEVRWGFQSNCLITPSYIKTFTGDEITNYDDKANEKLVAFVECTNTSGTGLVFTRLNDKYVAFKLWLGGSVISGTKSNDKLQVILDGKLLKANAKVETDSYSVILFGEDIVYMYNDYLAVYYNTEYMVATVDSNYNNNVCGLCSHQY